MRIPFPERVSYSGAVTFAVVLAGIQIFQGTNLYFSGLCVMFILLATLAFNIAGGMAFPSGTYVGANAVFTLALPLCVKVFLGEAADTHLHVPTRTLEVYVCGMIAMTIAAVMTRFVRPRHSLLHRVAPIKDLRAAYYGVSVMAIILTLYLMFVVKSAEDGSLNALLNQLNRFPVLAFLLGVAYTIKRTNGKQSVTWPLGIAILSYAFLYGVLSFSKEGFLEPMFCWVLVLALMRFNLRSSEWGIVIVLIYFISSYLTPYAQIGRHLDPDGRNRFAVAGYMLSNIDVVRDEWNQSLNNENEHSVLYYGTRLGLLDRMDIIGIDSALIDETDRDGTYGYEPAVASLSNFVPHVFWKDKPGGRYGNAYAHSVEVLADDDLTTGVSFSPAADAYHEGGIYGVLIVETIVLCIGFLMLDTFIGDVRENLAGVAMTALVIRAASESLLYGTVLLCAQPMVSVFFASILCAYFFPILGGLFGTRKVSASAKPASVATA